MTVLVDGENVRRSQWPNVTRRELLDLVAAWGEREGMRPVVFFEADETADDQIARAVAQLDGPYWLVTSDRELRQRAGRAAERVVGGGTFVRELSAAGGPRP